MLTACGACSLSTTQGPEFVSTCPKQLGPGGFYLSIATDPTFCGRKVFSSQEHSIDISSITGEILTMQETSAKVLLFGDENVDKHAALEMVTALSSLSAGVRKYLDAAFHALKQEAEKACPGDLAEVESLEDIVELAELSLGPDNVHDAAAAVVASITRTAELIS
jgi:hypothetical protein